MNLYESGEAGSRDLNVVHAGELAVVRDGGRARRGAEQGELNLLADGAVAIRDGAIIAVGETSEVLHRAGDCPRTIDARGMTVLPGLVECHSHPLFGGDRNWEYPRRIRGESSRRLRELGGGIWSSVLATRRASDEELLLRARAYYRAAIAGGVTTLEVKSGYGLTTRDELRCLALLKRSSEGTPIDLVYTFLGAHVPPHDGLSPTEFARLVREEMLPAVREQGIAEFHDLSCEAGDFEADEAALLIEAAAQSGLRSRVHADASSPSGGWRVAVEGGAIAADHLTYTPREEIMAIGSTETIAVLLPIAEQFYLDDRRANARAFIECGVPVGIATDFCSSFQATSLILSISLACSWFRITPAEAIVGATLNAAHVLGRATDRGSLDVGKRGDLVILDCPKADCVGTRIGAPLVDTVVSSGRIIEGNRGAGWT